MTEILLAGATLVCLGAGTAALSLRPNARRSTILQLVIGVVAALAVWRPSYAGGFRATLTLMAGEYSFHVSPRAFGPLLIFGALLTYSISGSASTRVLLSAVALAMTVVGLILPIFINLTSLWRPDFGLPPGPSGWMFGLGSQFSELIGVLAGIYVALLVYHLVKGRWPRWTWSIRIGAGLLAGHLAAALAVTLIGALGSNMWLATASAELLGWSFGAAVLAMLAWGSARVWRPDLLKAPGVPEARAPWRELWDMRSILERTEHQVLQLNDQLRFISEVRATLDWSANRMEMAHGVVERLVGYVSISGAALLFLHRGARPTIVARRGEFPQVPGLNTVDELDECYPAINLQVKNNLDESMAALIAELEPGFSTEVTYVQSGEALWGALLSVKRASSEFNLQERVLLEGVAADLGRALDHLSLQDRWSRRERELQALRDLNRRIIAERNSTSILKQVIRTAVALTGAQAGSAFTLDGDSSWAHCVAVQGDAPLPAGERIALGREWMGSDEESGLDGWMDSLGRAIGVDAGEQENQLYPIKWQEKPLAILHLNPGEGRKFSKQTSEFMRLLSGQAAAALENATLFDAELKRSEELEVLREASLSMTSSLELDEVLPKILRQALNLADAYDAHIFLYDGRQLFFGAAMWAGDVQQMPFSDPRENGLTYAVARSGERIVVPDIRHHLLYDGTEWTGAIVGIPLTVGDRVRGVMNVAYQEPHAFTHEELRALGLLADQAAIAIENAELFQRTAADRRRLQLLYDVTRELSSTLDPEQIMQRGAELTKDYLGASFGSVYLVDRRSELLRPHSSRAIGSSSSDWQVGAGAVRKGQGFVGRIAQSGKPARVDDLQSEKDWVPVEGIETQSRSAMGVPLTVGGETRGVLAVFHEEKGAFSSDQLELLLTISQQIGLAWSNATRYRQVERRLAERTAIQQVAQVVNSRLEMDELLEEVVNQVSRVLGYPIVDIVLVEGNELVVRAAAGLSEVGPVRIPLDKGVVGRVARTNEPAFVPDVDQDPDYIPIEAPSTSEIAVPLRKGEVVIGVLNVESHRAGDLTEDDLRLLSLVADQVAIAIENSALYERLRQHTFDLERKVADRTAELADALSQAQEADRLKTQFVSDVSHELRTPLSNIRLYLELLGQADPDRRVVYLETLHRESDRLVTLIEDLLSISRLDSGSIQARYDPLSLTELAAELVEDRQRLFAEKGLKLEWVPSPELPQILGDRRLLAQVLANLMTNALNYTTAGGQVKLQTELSEDGHWVKLMVRDTGLGILPDEREKVFDRFYRGSASREIGNPGTGLGLAISDEIVTRHRGYIMVKSVPGQGSEFQIWLPTAEAFSRPGASPVWHELSAELD